MESSLQRPRLLPTLLTAIAPLLATAALGWAVMDGPLDLGAGEKDILLLVPLVLWSVAFLVAMPVLCLRGVALRRAAGLAAALATALLAVLFLVMLVVSWR
jgi:hypothetical protein